MNLAVSGTSHVAATIVDSSALLYQQADQHQLQPISYKIPQVGTVLVAQHHPQFTQPLHQQHHPHHVMTGIMSMPEKKKDIIAQAMREEKIYNRGKACRTQTLAPHRITECDFLFFTSYSLLDDNYVTHGSPAASTPEPPMMPTPIPVAVKSNPPPMNTLSDLRLNHGEQKTFFCLVFMVFYYNNALFRKYYG